MSRVSAALPAPASYDDALNQLPFACFTLQDTSMFSAANHAAYALQESNPFFAHTALDAHSPLGRWLLPLTQQAHTSHHTIKDSTLLASSNSTMRQSFTVWIQPITHGALLLFEQSDSTITHSDLQASAALMTAMLAHEIRNPLLAISGAAQLLKNAGAQEALCTLIQHETARIERLLKDLEPLRGQSALSLAPINIHQSLASAIAHISAGIGTHIRFEQQYDPSLPDIEADAASLERALINLLKNAAEACATVAQPTITLTTRYGQIKELRGIILDIHDNGIGIPAALTSQLFHPFITSKKDGRGLGLPIATRIIEDHAGHVELLYSHKSSTLFRIFLPSSRLQQSQL